MNPSYLEVVGAFLALAGFAFGLYQYTITQKWKKAEYAAGLLLRLSEDQVLSVCCQVLDWSSRKLPLPERFRLDAAELTIEHKWDLLVEGIKPETERRSFTRPQEIYRDLFDHFFAYLEEVNHFIDIQLIERHQVSSLRYRLEQIAAPRFATGNPFETFLIHYGYSGVLDLMKKFEVKFRGAA